MPVRVWLESGSTLDRRCGRHEEKDYCLFLERVTALGNKMKERFPNGDNSHEIVTFGEHPLLDSGVFTPRRHARCFSHYQ